MSSQEEVVQRYIEASEKALEEERLRRVGAENRYNQASGFDANRERDALEIQLNLDKEIDKIYHLLSGHVLRTVNGSRFWDEPDDDRMKILSEYGVKQIMNLISLYITPNTILSVYDEDTIKWKTKDFGIELNYLLYNRYEMFFHYPSPEELFELYKPIARRQGMDITDEKLYYKCVDWSEEELAGKYRHYPIICLAIIDFVHSAFLRALNGATLRSLRSMTHISQTLTQQPQLQPQPQKTGLSGLWGSKK